MSSHDELTLGNGSPASQERLGGEGQHHVRHPADVDAREAGWHHADDSEREEALHGELTADDLVGAAEVLAPEAIADDRDGTVRRCGCCRPLV